MDEKTTRQRPMVNAATISRCSNIAFLGMFLNAAGGKRKDLIEDLGVTTQAFCRWFKVDDIRYSTLCRIYEHYGCTLQMKFTYPDGKGPSRAMAATILNMLDASRRLNPLFVEMKLNNQNFDSVGKVIGRTSQAVNHWFLEDEIAVSMIYKFAQALGATVEFVAVKK